MIVQPVSTTKPTVEVAPVVKPKVKLQVPQGSGENKKKRDIEFLRNVLQLAQNHLGDSGVSISFSVHEATGRIKVDVTDKETGKLIREIPPEQALNLMAKIDEMMGILYDKKA